MKLQSNIKYKDPKIIFISTILGMILISSILAVNPNASALSKNQDPINSNLPVKNLPPPPPPPDKCKTGQTFKICQPGVIYNPPPPPPPPPQNCPHPEVVCPFPDKIKQ